MDNIVMNKYVLEYLMKQAQAQSKTLKVSAVFETFVKLSQDYVSELKKIEQNIPSIQEDLFYALVSKRYNDDQRREIIEKIIRQNENNFYIYLLSKARTPEIQDALNTYYPKFSSNMVNKIMDYKGEKARTFELKGLLNGVLANATMYAKGKKINQTERGKKEQGLETETGKDGNKMESNYASEEKSPEQALIDAEEALEKGPKAEGVEAFEDMIEAILNDPSEDILALYLEGKTIPEFKEIKARLSAASGRELAQAEADFYQFMKETTQYIEANMGAKRKYEQRGAIRENTLRDVQQYVNEAFKKLDIDELANNILASQFYTLPRWAKEKNPDIIKEIIKSLIKSTMIVNMKDALGVSLPQATAEGKGRRRLAHIDLMYSILVRSLRKLQQDPDEQQKLIREAAKMIGTTFNKASEPIHADKSALNYPLFMHATPMVLSGIFNQEASRMGETFNTLSGAEAEDLINRVYSRVYPALPHTTPGGLKHKREGLHQIENGENVAKNYLREMLRKIQAIQSGKEKPGSMMSPMTPVAAEMPELPEINLGDDSLSKESALNQLIRKYAFKY